MAAFRGDRALHVSPWQWVGRRTYVRTIWQLHDATFPSLDETVDDLFYLPLGTLTNEGPGYTMAIADFAVLRPAKIYVVPTPNS